jgi:dipicolinate synthase subunit A
LAKRLNVCIIGGDERYLEVIDQLVSKGIHIFLHGYDQRTFSHTNITNSIPDNFKEIDAILLPLNGTDTAGNIEAVYSERSIKLTKEMLAETPEHCAVYTGISTDYLERTVNSANRALIRLTDRDDIAVLNSIPTAEATLHRAIEETNYTIHGANVAVVGFGRVGFTLARLFSAVGANVIVAARKAADFARITEMGMQPIHVHQLSGYIPEVNICINTVPHKVLDETVLSQTEKSTLIIDVASKPGGTDFEFAEEKGIKAIHALGLPGKTAPKTAGKIISDIFYKLLNRT